MLVRTHTNYFTYLTEDEVFHESGWSAMLQFHPTRIINLVVRCLNAYVGKERIHCFPFVRPVAMTQIQLSWWSGATGIQNNSSLLVIRCTRRVISDFMCCT